MSKPWNPGPESADELLDPLIAILGLLAQHPDTKVSLVKRLLEETKAEPMPYSAMGTSFTMEGWLELEPKPSDYPKWLILRAFRYGIEQGRRLAVQRLSDGGAVGFVSDAKG